ncbi:hypothetical protein L0B52_04415 [Suttonella sp. R2A3]|nr:hypothetical protein [Suttonella sp. R2A3]UJF25396.1 hypothetical protein L0B52_04415 [Suttonella sp. R2A3]
MPRPIPAVFGSVFYEQMPVSVYQSGWQAVSWQGSDSLNLHPAAHVLHYGSTCFEGLKAFRHGDGRMAIFSPRCTH